MDLSRPMCGPNRKLEKQNSKNKKTENYIVRNYTSLVIPPTGVTILDCGSETLEGKTPAAPVISEYGLQVPGLSCSLLTCAASNEDERAPGDLEEEY